LRRARGLGRDAGGNLESRAGLGERSDFSLGERDLHVCFLMIFGPPHAALPSNIPTCWARWASSDTHRGPISEMFPALTSAATSESLRNTKTSVGREADVHGGIIPMTEQVPSRLLSRYGVTPSTGGPVITLRSVVLTFSTAPTGTIAIGVKYLGGGGGGGQCDPTEMMNGGV
jgi:hypothetical protein